MFCLVYPASFLPHKNHCLLEKPEVLNVLKKHGFALKITLALPASFRAPHELVQNLGRISREESLNLIAASDALLFLSSCESLGVPLLEAAMLGKPVVCPDLPYSRELLGCSAYYFNFQNFLLSFEQSLETLSEDLRSFNEKKAILQKKVIPLRDAFDCFLALLD